MEDNGPDPANTGGRHPQRQFQLPQYNTTFYESEEDAQIMSWLSPLELNNRRPSGNR